MSLSVNKMKHLVLLENRLCPFCQRVRISLAYKNIPYQVLQINLQQKPEWYKEINPLQRVPTLLIYNEAPQIVEGQKPPQPEYAICESDLIMSTLDSMSQNSQNFIYPLLPGQQIPDPFQKALIDLEVKEQKIGGLFAKCLIYDIHNKENRDQLLIELQKLEDRLQDPSRFYMQNGQITAIDIAIYPFLERLYLSFQLGYVNSKELAYKLKFLNYPKLITYILNLRETFKKCGENAVLEEQLWSGFWELQNVEPYKGLVTPLSKYYDANEQRVKVLLLDHHLCPFAHRARVTLSYRQIPYKSIQMDLVQKPQWFFKYNPGGKVPTILYYQKGIPDFAEGSEPPVPDFSFYESKIAIDFFDNLKQGQYKHVYPRDENGNLDIFKKAKIDLEIESRSQLLSGFLKALFFDKDNQENNTFIINELQKVNDFLQQPQKFWLQTSEFTAVDNIIYPPLERLFINAKFDFLNKQLQQEILKFQNIISYLEAVKGVLEKDAITDETMMKGLMILKQKAGSEYKGLTVPLSMYVNATNEQ